MDQHAAASALALLHAELSGLVAAGVRLAALAPPPWAALLAGAGVAFAFHGARRRHLLAAPGGAVLGLLAARMALAALDRTGAVQAELLWVAAGGGALVCAAWPPLFPVLALALPAAAAGGLAGVAGRAWLGAVLGAAVGVGLGALLREWVAALAAGGLGAAAVVAGGLGLLSRRPIVAELAERPFALVAVWVVLAVAGAAFHAGRAWPKPGAPRREGPELAQPDEEAWDSREADR